jgi:ribonuclease HI
MPHICDLRTSHLMRKRSVSVSKMKQVTIHCDGACQGNPGPGGWAAVLQYGEKRKEICGAVVATTNNRMELQAAIEGLRALKEACEVEVFTDSEYLRNGITSWVRGWKYKGWMTKERKPVKNADLWRELDALANGHKVTWRWLKGHAGHVDNERCDALAVEQISVLRKRCTKQELKRALKEFKEQAAGVGTSKLL